MRRLRNLGVLFAGLLAGVAPAAAQQPSGQRIRLFFFETEGSSGDSAYTAQAGGAFRVLVRASQTSARGLAAFTFRVYYDAAKVAFDSARSSCPDSLNSPLQAPVTGSNYVQLSASNCTITNVANHNVATVNFRLLGGATEGAGLYLEPRALMDALGVNRLLDADGDYDEVCLAVGIWGDVDDDGRVNSRDALIALSNAVGLPTPGYPVSRGDVDADGVVGSRDALAMLSASIGYPPAYGFRTGKGAVTACARDVVLPRTMYFIRGGTSPGAPGVSGLAIRAAGDSAVVIAGDSAETYPDDSQGIRVSPDGAYVVFVCRGAFSYQDICRANADGSGLVNLTNGSFLTHGSPDWSPASDSIVFLRNSGVWIMAADGANAHPVASAPSAYAVAWAPGTGSRRVAYVTATFPGAIRTLDLDNAAPDSLVFDFTAWSGNGYYPRRVDWSPAGDSLVFSLVVNGLGATLAVPRGGGVPARVGALFNASSTYTYPVWTDQGTLFSSYRIPSGPGITRYRLFRLRPDGRVEQIRRGDTQDNFAPAMDKQ
jgi:hypothetical protein